MCLRLRASLLGWPANLTHQDKLLTQYLMLDEILHSAWGGPPEGSQNEFIRHWRDAVEGASKWIERGYPTIDQKSINLGPFALGIRALSEAFNNAGPLGPWPFSFTGWRPCRALGWRPRRAPPPFNIYLVMDGPMALTLGVRGPIAPCQYPFSFQN